jgi:peptidoglycan/LPS O-acetylase OafA/YrhL
VPGELLFTLLVLVMRFALIRWQSLEPLILMALPAVICTTVLAQPSSVRPSRTVSDALQKIGVISYSLYLWHPMFTWDAPRYTAPWFASASILALAATWLSYRYVEIPFIALGKRLSLRLGASQRGLRV